MQTFYGFRTFLEDQAGTRGKVISTFDFDETLTVWSNWNDAWRQVPNTKNIKEFVYPQYRRGNDLYIVTFRDPALAKDPRFQIYEKIEQYIDEWGMNDVIKGVIYTRLHPKGDYIYHLCKSKSLPFMHHYDDDHTNCQDVENNQPLRELAIHPESQIAIHLPYSGPRPPKSKAAVIVPGE